MHPQPSRRQRGALLIELRILKWWEVLVMLQFVASDFVLRHLIYRQAAGSLPKKWLREWESHPPVEVYEASLCALVEFPAIKWWRRRVTLPFGSACRAGASLFCHTPIYILASRPGAAPGRLSFGDSAAQAGARLNGIGAAARNRTRTFGLAGRHSAVKSQPRN